ncbi:HAMP domain-containing protein [Streptomyces chattanoogensis]
MPAPPPKRWHTARRRADMSLLGGIRPPIAVLSILLLALAGVTALTLGRAGQDRVPQAVLTSQQHFAEDSAIALRASIDASAAAMTRTAALLGTADPVPADAVLDKVGDLRQKWLGTAVVDATSGRLLAARGENLPLNAIDRAGLTGENGLAPRLVRLPGGETRLLSFALLDRPGEPRKLLVASRGLTFPGVRPGGARTLAVIDAQGHVLSRNGGPEPAQGTSARQRDERARSARQLKAFAAYATEKAKQHPLKAKEPGSGGFQGVSGSVTGDADRGHRALAGYATLAAHQPGESTAATGLGLTVVATVKVPEAPAAAGRPVFGLLAAAALLLTGGLTVALLLGTVQRPLLSLFRESRRLARGDLARPVNAPKYGEAARIGGALERLRRQLLGEQSEQAGQPEPSRPRPARPRFGTRTLLAVCGVLLLAWSAPLLLLFNRAGGSVDVPQQIVDDQRERTATVTDRMRLTLAEGHAELVTAASHLGGGTNPARMTEVLRRTMADNLRYTAVYVVDAGGRVLARAGGEPHSPKGNDPATAPIRVVDDQGREPLITAAAGVAGRRGVTVVGEFRIEFLNSILRRPGLGVVRVVDAERRVVAGNTGYLAFERLPDGRMDALAEKAEATGRKADGTGRKAQKPGKSPVPTGVLLRDGDETRIAAAAPFADGGAAKPLGWTAVSWQPASGLALAENDLENITVLAGLLGITAAAACLGWLGIVVVRPLRALADRAEALADGDRRTVLYPTHHDEVGAVARSLELIRQQLSEQGQGQGHTRDGATPSAGRN